ISLDVVRAFQAELQEVWGDQRIERIPDAQYRIQQIAWFAEEKLGLRKTAVIFEFICGACSGLDEYTYYLTPAGLEAINASWNGRLVGVGIEVATLNDKLVITQVLPGSSAQANGIKAGDQVTRIGGQSTQQLVAEAATDLLKGEIDTTIDVEILP